MGSTGKYAINWISFLKYLMKQIIAVFLAPLLAFGIAVIVALLKNPDNLRLNSIFTDCVHGDILLSILSVYVILYGEYLVVYKGDAERYLERIRWIIKPLKISGGVLFAFLCVAAIVFKFHGNSLTGVIPHFFEAVEAIGFTVGIVLQCVSHPKEYMATRSKD